MPALGIRRAAVKGGLAALRGVFLSFVSALLVILVVTLFLAPGFDDAEREDTGLVTAVVGGVGGLSVLASTRLARALVCSSPQALAGAYRTRFFLRIALSEAAALVGFVGALVAGSVLPYLVGLALALVGFAHLAPTNRNLARDEEALRVAGCPHSLVAALTSH